MSCRVNYDKKVVKYLKKLSKSAPKEYIRISRFLNRKLPSSENPCLLPNAKHLSGFDDNRYRWRLGDYRIIGIVKNETFFVVQVIKISKRDDSTYKGL